MSNKTEIIIDGNNKGAITAINGVDQKLKSVSGTVNGQFSQSMSLLSKHLGMTAVIGAATSFGYLAKQAIDTADELYKMSQKVGVSVESLSTLKYAAELSDLSMEQMQIGLKKLSTNLYDIAHGSGKEASVAFGEIGVVALDVTGKMRPTEQILLDVADKFAGMSDGAEKSAIAVKLFGKAGLELIPFLNQGKDGIKALTDEAEKLGLKISTETGQSAERFNDTLTTFKNTLNGLVTESLPPLLEDLNNFTQGVLDLNTAVQDFSGENLLQGFTRAIKNFGTLGIDVKQLTGINDQVKAFIRQQKEVKRHTEEVNKVFMQTFGIQNNAYPLMVDNVKRENNELDKKLNTIRAIKDEYAKMVEVIARGEGQKTASGAGGLFPSFSELEPRGVDYNNNMFLPETNLFNPLEEQAINFFDMYDERAALMRQNTADMFGNMGNAASAFYQLSGQKAKQWFAIQKSFAIAQALINTYEGATKALAQGGFFGIAMAAAVITAGLANVAMIASQNPSSGGGAARGSSGGSSVGSQAISNDRGTGNYSPGQRQTVNIIVNGSIVDHSRFARDIVPYLNDAVAAGVS